MNDPWNEIDRVARLPANKASTIDEATLKDHVFTAVTGLSPQAKDQWLRLAVMLFHVRAINKKAFLNIFSPFLDFLRASPSVDFFSLVLEVKGASASDIASLMFDLLNDGTISAFDLEALLPRSPTPRNVSLLAIMMKRAESGMLQDIIVEKITNTLFPEDTFTFSPENFMNPEFMSKVLGSLDIVAALCKKSYPVELVISQIGEARGSQAALFLLLMLSQGFLTDVEVKGILDRMENPTFATMYENAKKTMESSMESMMPPEMRGMAPFGARGQVRLPLGAGAGRLLGGAGGSVLGRLLGTLGRLFGRFRGGV